MAWASSHVDSRSASGRITRLALGGMHNRACRPTPWPSNRDPCCGSRSVTRLTVVGRSSRGFKLCTPQTHAAVPPTMQAAVTTRRLRLRCPSAAPCPCPGPPAPKDRAMGHRDPEGPPVLRGPLLGCAIAVGFSESPADQSSVGASIAPAQRPRTPGSG
jgi:hypothetical protein